ncbi:MAG: tRNA (adenosine(37)-N6)-threonylcarbamoyltransferase complex dimerization subunit type 1 TsaB [Balneolaceae bacterium]|nr:tRNA (adenosine(37)-N6)-threonylcarbamoyltransferase complex dimerization subunit type 1 TsaB [Balneolaceae bacterium]
MILAVETSTNICSVSFQDTQGKIHEKRTERKGSHSELLFIFIRELMEELNIEIADLDAVLVSNGPGSYTGLRIAASAVKGLLFGLDVEVYAANTLAGFAQGGQELVKNSDANVIHAVINARRNHLYHQQFSYEDSLTPITEAAILELEAIEAMLEEGHLIVGTGIERLSDDKRKRTEVYGTEAVHAGSLIKLFNSASKESVFSKTKPEELESNYISSSQVNNTTV